MNNYIPADKLISEIERLYEIARETSYNGEIEGEMTAYDKILSFIADLQQEPEDKQIIIITESHGDANIKWDCRSLDDVIVLLKSAESFITEKQIEKIAGPGSGPDYATTEGRYSHLFKRQQEQPEVDFEKAFAHEYAIYHLPTFIIASIVNGTELIDFIYKTARHFAEWGAIHLNARKGK